MSLHLDNRDARDGIPAPVEVHLTESDRRSLEGLSTEQKACRVVRKYLHDKYGRGVVIEEAHGGADLRVSVGGEEAEAIAVKGTATDDIAWAKLKVSSRQSYRALKNRTARMYRVVNVNSAKPRIFILEFGTHYKLIPEPRWAVRAASREAKSYPLRGAPYRREPRRPCGVLVAGNPACNPQPGRGRGLLGFQRRRDRRLRGHSQAPR